MRRTGPPSRSAALLAGVLLAAVLAGCASRSPASQPASRATAAAAPTAPCATFGCRPQQPQPLTGGYSVRLWLSAAPSTAQPQAERSTPVLELLRDGLT